MLIELLAAAPATALLEYLPVRIQRVILGRCDVGSSKPSGLPSASVGNCPTLLSHQDCIDDVVLGRIELLQIKRQRFTVRVTNLAAHLQMMRDHTVIEDAVHDLVCTDEHALV